MRRCRPVHIGLAAAVLAFAGMLLTACNNLIPETPKTQSPNIIDQVQSIDLLPRFPELSGPATVNRGKGTRAVVYNGSAESADGNSTAPLQGADAAATGDGYDLSFENAPVTTVAKVILGDILGVGYIIDPRVQGTVTLTSGRPVAKIDVLYVLESALRVSNVALVRETNGYRLIPANEAIANGRLDVMADGRVPQAGYGVTVIPLRYVSASTITALHASTARAICSSSRVPDRSAEPRSRPSLISIPIGCAIKRSEFFPCSTARRNRSSPKSKRSWISAKAASTKISLNCSRSAG